VATLALMVRVVARVTAAVAIFCNGLGTTGGVGKTLNAEVEPMADRAMIVETFIMLFAVNSL